MLQVAFSVHNTTHESCTEVTILICGWCQAKQFPDVKYGYIHCAFQTFHFFAGSVAGKWFCWFLLYCGRIINSKWIPRIHLPILMMMSSNGNLFRVTGPLCGEFTGHRWIPLMKGQWRGLWCFFDVGPQKLLNKQSNDRWFKTTRRSCAVIVMHPVLPSWCLDYRIFVPMPVK